MTLNDLLRYSRTMPARADLAAALRAMRERRGLSLEQVGRRTGMAKTNVQAIELNRSGPSLDRYEALAAALGAELVITLRPIGEAAADEALLSAAAQLPPDRRALLLRLASAISDVDDAMLRGAVDGLEGWARAGRASRALG